MKLLFLLIICLIYALRIQVIIFRKKNVLIELPHKYLINNVNLAPFIYIFYSLSDSTCETIETIYIYIIYLTLELDIVICRGKH